MSSIVTRACTVGRRKASGGFTLIEIIVSLAIIAVLMPPIMYGLNLANQAASLARNRTIAGMLGQQKLDELLAVGPLDNESGDFGDSYAQFKWSSEMSTPDDNPTVDGVNDTLQELDVHVTWKQAGQTRELVLGTMVYQTPTSTGTSTGTNTGLSGGLP